jgi:hypothetical protein
VLAKYEVGMGTAAIAAPAPKRRVAAGAAAGAARSDGRPAVRPPQRNSAGPASKRVSNPVRAKAAVGSDLEWKQF